MRDAASDILFALAVSVIVAVVALWAVIAREGVVLRFEGPPTQEMGCTG